MKIPKIIIVEGIDRVGKTTLVNKLAENFGYEIFKPLGNNKDKIQQVEKEKIMSIVSMLSTLRYDKVIIDRLHLSEFVYGKVDRGYVYADFNEVDKLLSRLNSLLIFVKPTDLARSSKEHGSNLRNHSDWFHFIYNNSRMNKIACDYNSLDTIVESLERGTWV